MAQLFIALLTIIFASMNQIKAVHQLGLLLLITCTHFEVLLYDDHYQTSAYCYASPRGCVLCPHKSYNAIRYHRSY